MKSLLIIITVLLISMAVCGQDKSERYSDLKGGFSFDVPQDWRAYEMPNARYRVVFGERQSGFTPNITVEDDACPCALADYVDLAQRRFEAHVKDAGLDAVKLLNKTEFVTSSGLKGWKLTNAGTAKAMSMVFRQYIFGGKDKKQFIFTCSALAESASSIETACDGAMKTLTFAN